MFEVFLVQGLAVPCRVVSGSMAETLLGSHRRVVCADCGMAFPCDADRRPVASRAVCPNCGYAANRLDDLPDIDGDRVLIDRRAFSLRRPRRWEVVAIRSPQKAGEMLVKRVVGLPGETVEIRGGDVYVDGQIQRKNLAQQRALAVLVYDADHPPTQTPPRGPMPPPRWRPNRPQSGWISTGGCFTHKHKANSENRPTDWLVYHHWHRMAGGGVIESPVTDVCGYNPSQTRREEDVSEVSDLLLSFRLSLAGHGAIHVRAADGADGRDTFDVRLQMSEKKPEMLLYQAFHGGKPIPDACGWVEWTGRRLVEVSLVDQQLLLALDSRMLIARPYRRSASDAPSTTPLAIGVEGGLEATVDQLRVYRDVCYTSPLGGRNASPPRRLHLAADEYFVVGDNSPISDDSRNWPDPAAINARLLVGKPLVAIPSLGLSLLPLWHFQVPNPAGIRYIR